MKRILALMVLIALIPSANASLWAADANGAWRFNGSGWDAKENFATSFFSDRIHEMSGPDDNLYAVGEGPTSSDHLVQVFDGTSWTDISSDIPWGGSGSFDDIRGVHWVSEDEIWISGGTTDSGSSPRVFLFNGIQWSQFVDFNPCPGGNLDIANKVQRTENYLWVSMQQCDGSSDPALIFCQLPSCSSFTGLLEGFDNGEGSSLSCESDTRCWVTVHTNTQARLYACNATTSSCQRFLSGNVGGSPVGTRGGFASVFVGQNSTLGVYGQPQSSSDGWRNHYDGTTWVSEQRGASNWDDAFAYSETRGALLREVTVDGSKRVAHWDGSSWSNNQPTTSSGLVQLGGLQGATFTETEDVLPTEPSEFDSGFVQFVSDIGFQTVESQMFMSVILVGIATVIMSASTRFMRPGPLKNSTIGGVAMLVGVFTVLLFFLELWMFVLAFMVGVFAIRGTRDVRNTYHEIVARIRQGPGSLPFIAGSGTSEDDVIMFEQIQQEEDSDDASDT